MVRRLNKERAWRLQLELDIQDSAESGKDSRPQDNPCAQAASMAGKSNIKCSTDRSRALLTS